MRIRVGDLKDLIETQASSCIFDQMHRALHEAAGEAPACKIRFQKGQKYEIHIATRVIPDPKRPGMYFGGEKTERASRGRGTTTETITPGQRLLCYDVSGSEGYFIVPSERGNLRVRIHVNKFCPITRSEEEQKRLAKMGKGNPGVKAKGDISDDEIAAMLGYTVPTKPKAPNAKPMSKAEEIARLKAQLAALESGDDEKETPESNEGEIEDFESLFK